MESHQAADHLEVIRTLMERAALYRRALAPTTLVTGAIGASAGLLAFALPLDSLRRFSLYWLTVAVLALVGAFLVVRRQALRDLESFWTPPTRRVAQALAPPLFAGLVTGLLGVFSTGEGAWAAGWLPAFWMMWYGCALHAAGFFMMRGIKLLGWFYVALGFGLIMLLQWRGEPHAPTLREAHGWMGAAFGGLHLAYGLYLQFTERRPQDA